MSKEDSLATPLLKESPCDDYVGNLFEWFIFTVFPTAPMPHRLVKAINRTCTHCCYPWVFITQATIKCPASVANGRWFRNLMLAIWFPGTCVFYTTMWTSQMGALTSFVIHFLWFWSWDYVLLWMAICGQLVVIMQRIKRDKSRLMTDKLLGKHVLIIGNGPSACTGEPVGRDVVDSFDEVVRFNNGTIKTHGKEEYVGTKTTVHVSDAMLFPTYPEYHVEGAEVLLAQYDERLMTQGSYWFFRLVIDLDISVGWKCLTSPALAWIPHDEIHALKAELASTTFHQPTSGMLAINHFLKKTDVVYIHGFDFFEGPTIHYFDEKEPLYERINNHLGVYMHEPKKEKAKVHELIAKGKVRWLKDFAAEKRKT